MYQVDTCLYCKILKLFSDRFPVSPRGNDYQGVFSLTDQSCSPDLREALGRRAQADPAEAFLRLRAAGAANLSVDLIHGIPGQTMAALDADLAAVLDLAPDHISWYELTLAPGTPLARRAQGRAPRDEVDEEADGAAVGGAASDSTAGAADTTGGTTGGTAGGITRGAAAADDYDDPTDDARADFYERVVQTLSSRGLRLVRGEQLRPSGAQGAPQPRVLARPALPRSRARRREHGRRAALDQPRGSRGLGRRPGCGRAPAARGRGPGRGHARPRTPAARGPLRRPRAARRAQLPSSIATPPAPSPRLDWFPCTVVQSG